jgi:hypothetical protein
LTVDLRFFDFPNIIVMMLAGSAIGRMALLGRAKPGGDRDKSVQPAPRSARRVTP